MDEEDVIYVCVCMYICVCVESGFGGYCAQ